MKTTFTIAALSLASVLSFGASAANLVTNEQVASQNLQSVGTVSVSGIDGTPMISVMRCQRKRTSRAQPLTVSSKHVTTVTITPPLNCINNTVSGAAAPIRDMTAVMMLNPQVVGHNEEINHEN